jgi:hypothetical protein
MNDDNKRGVSDSEGLRRRIQYLLELRWNGNMRQMARALGLSHALISLVVSGKQNPGRRLIAALTEYPGIDRTWVLTGNGHPVPFPEQGSLPLSTGVLPGSPNEFPHLLTGERHPAADCLCRASRYWLPILTGSHLIGAKEFRLAVGDLMMVETAPQWYARPDQVIDRFCGVRIEHKNSSQLVFGPIRRRDNDHLYLDVPSAVLLNPMVMPADAPVHRATVQPNASLRRQRTIRMLDKKKPKAPAGRQAILDGQHAEHSRELTIAQVVGLCIYVARPSPLAY